MKNWKGTNEDVKVVGSDVWGVNIIGGNYPIITIDEFTESKSEANAYLIADALNTVNKCDLMPSEVLKQRDELLQALKVAKSHMDVFLPKQQKQEEHEKFSKEVLAFCERQNCKPSDIGKAINYKLPSRFDTAVHEWGGRGFTEGVKARMRQYMQMVEGKKVEG